MKTALIMGATGLVGEQLLALLLEDTRYSQITVLVRKPFNQTHPKLVQKIFHFDQPERQFLKGDELYCCLGTTIKTAGTKEAFFKVDHDYVVHTAQQAFENGIKKAAFISSIGATTDSAVFYTKTKGQMEDDVKHIGFDSCFIFRPSMLLGQRKEFRLGERIGKVAMTVFSFVIPKKYKGIDAKRVAKAMILTMNSGKTGVDILTNEAMLNLTAAN